MVEKLQEKIELSTQVKELFFSVGAKTKASEFVIHDDHTLGRLKRRDRFGDGIHLFLKRSSGDYVHLMCYLEQSLLATEPGEIFLTAYFQPNVDWGQDYSYAMPQGWFKAETETLTNLMNRLVS